MLPPWRREKRLLLRGPIATLGEAMRALRRGTRCRIIVSNALARFALVPFSTAVVGRAAEEALASHVLRGTHGERVDAWRVRVAPARPGEQRLACALDAALLDAIPGAAQAHGVQVSAIEPAWAVGFNAAYRRLPASCWFAVTEPGRLVLGLQIDGEWRQLASHFVIRSERIDREPGWIEPHGPELRARTDLDVAGEETDPAIGSGLESLDELDHAVEAFHPRLPRAKLLVQRLDVLVQQRVHARVDQRVGDALHAHQIAHDLHVRLAVVPVARVPRCPERVRKRALHGTTTGAVAPQNGSVDVEENELHK